MAIYYNTQGEKYLETSDSNYGERLQNACLLWEKRIKQDGDGDVLYLPIAVANDCSAIGAFYDRNFYVLCKSSFSTTFAFKVCEALNKRSYITETALEDVVTPVEFIEMTEGGFNPTNGYSDPSKKYMRATVDDENDNVEHPKHYTSGKYECIDELRALFGDEAVKAFCRCNVYKYHKRAALKNGEEDLKKADWYMGYLMKLVN